MVKITMSIVYISLQYNAKLQFKGYAACKEHKDLAS